MKATEDVPSQLSELKAREGTHSQLINGAMKAIKDVPSQLSGLKAREGTHSQLSELEQ